MNLRLRNSCLFVFFALGAVYFFDISQSHASNAGLTAEDAILRELIGNQEEYLSVKTAIQKGVKDHFAKTFGHDRFSPAAVTSITVLKTFFTLNAQPELSAIDLEVETTRTTCQMRAYSFLPAKYLRGPQADRSKKSWTAQRTEMQCTLNDAEYLVPSWASSAKNWEEGPVVNHVSDDYEVPASATETDQFKRKNRDAFKELEMPQSIASHPAYLKKHYKVRVSKTPGSFVAIPGTPLGYQRETRRFFKSSDIIDAQSYYVTFDDGVFVLDTDPKPVYAHYEIYLKNGTKHTLTVDYVSGRLQEMP